LAPLHVPGCSDTLCNLLTRQQYMSHSGLQAGAGTRRRSGACLKALTLRYSTTGRGVQACRLRYPILL